MFNVNDVIGVKPEYDQDGRWKDARGTILAKDETTYHVSWATGESITYTHQDVHHSACLIMSGTPRVHKPGDPHNCAEHMEFCQGFRFDYHFCKVCGSKKDSAA